MRPRQRRFFVPATFAGLAVVLAWGSVRLGGDTDHPPIRAPARTAAPITPVLSVRRIAAFLAAPIADAFLRAELDRIVAQSPPATCLTASAGGRLIYQHNPDLGLVPASTQKLVTATAALADLGADAHLRTRVVAATKPKAGVVAGDLWIVGGGDPLLSTNPYAAHFEHQPQIHTSLEGLADAVKAAGVDRVEGRVLGDESRYDHDRYPDGWPARYASQNQSGPLSALSVNDGFTSWPAHQMVGAPEETAAADPPTYAADQLRLLLQQRGVIVDGGAGSGKAPAGVEIAGKSSPPMKDIVREMLSESDNQTAELLVKELGRAKGGAATTTAGVAVISRSMKRLGLSRAGTRATDGSGLDEANRTSCALLMHILDRDGPTSVLSRSLAVAGTSGTLADRFLDSPAKGRLRAKTGTLNTVTALTGFVNATQGPVITFAYVANGRTVDDAFLKLQETMGADLVAYPQGPSLKSLGPRSVR